MAVKSDTIDEIKEYYYRKCNKCGIRVHTERMYCKCGQQVSHNDIYVSNTYYPVLEKCNVDVEGFTCDSCSSCTYCASYGMERRNNAGYGGLDCKYRRDDIRCKCCEIMIRNWIKKDGGIDSTLKRTIEAIARISKNRT